MTSEIVEFATLLRRLSWSRAQVDDLRRSKLRRLILHAYENVPYYRRRMDLAGVRPSDIASPADLARLPVTTKQELRAAGPDALSDGAEGLLTLHTSGHSGVPFEIHLTDAEDRTRRLREFRMLIEGGFRPRDRLTILGPIRSSPKRLHRRLGLYRMERIAHTLPVEEQIRRLRLSRPDVLWAFPTVLKTVLYRAGCNLSSLARPRLLLTSAQVMEQAFRRQLLDDLPGLQIADIYGSAETGRIAAECRLRQGLHVEEDALIVELLKDGEPVEAGSEGSVVITCLDQFAMPFIRYELSDLCRARLQGCPCGRQGSVLEALSGRDADMISLPDGGKVSALLLSVSLREEKDLLQCRFVQDRRDHITAELFFGNPPSPDHLAVLRKAMEECAAGLAVEIELVREMRFEGSKFKVFVSRL